MPPPTVKGMKTVSATRRTMSITMSRRSWLAVMSRKTSSSAPSPIVYLRLLHRIAGVAQLEKVDPLDHPAVLHVQAGDDAFGEHGIDLVAINLPMMRLVKRDACYVNRDLGSRTSRSTYHGSRFSQELLLRKKALPVD